MDLVLKNIGKTYPLNKKALNNVNIELGKGIYGLLGENGAGKSTLMRIISTVDNSTSGEVYYNSVPISKQSEDYRSELGYLPQSFEVYDSFSAMDFLEYIGLLKGLKGKSLRNKVHEMLNFVNLFEVRNKKVKSFSGGMKQRLGIAQALINDPKVLLLDEPTAGLDPVERIRFYKILSYMSSEKIVIVSTHIVADIEAITDKIIIINNGEIITQGKCSDLIEEIDGSVVEFYLEKNEDLHEYLDSVNILKIQVSDNQTKIRCLIDNRECIKFDKDKLVNPSLEDYFIYSIGSGRDD